MKKLISVLMSLTLLMGMVSCGKHGDDITMAEKVPEDGTWWNEIITEITAEEIEKELDVTPAQISGIILTKVSFWGE